MSEQTEREDFNAAAAEEYYAHCAEEERRQAEDVPPMPDMVGAFEAGAVTPELITEWATHPYVCVSDLVLRCFLFLDAARRQVEAQHQEALKRAHVEFTRDALAGIRAERQAEIDGLADALASLRDAGNAMQANYSAAVAELTTLRAQLTEREQGRCEWGEDAEGLMRSSHRGYAPKLATALTYNFCPYCGKRLEITRLKGATA